MKKIAKMIDINDIPVGSKFHGPIDIERVSKEDIEKANKWWNSLPPSKQIENIPRYPRSITRSLE